MVSYTKYILYLLFGCTLFVAIFVRFYKLGNLPSGLTWDEAAIGYNAYGLLVNHRDEWLHRLPLSFQSFGDFKSPLLIYLTTLPVLFLGPTAFAIRVWNALFGVGIVILSFLLTRHFLVNQMKEKSRTLVFLSALSVALLCAVSPWGIHYSRMGFESLLSSFFVVSAVYAYYLWVASTPGRNRAIFLFLFFTCSILSMYAYHSAKIVIPILWVLVFFSDRKLVFSRIREIFLIGLLSSIFAIPLLYSMFFGHANSRAVSTTVLTSDHAIVFFLQNYTKHLSVDFLLRGKDQTYRHGTLQMGVLYPIELVFFLASTLVMLQKKYRKFLLFLLLFFAGLIPASLGLDAPHANRAFLAYPWIQMMCGCFFYWAVKYLFEKKYARELCTLFFIGFLGVLVASFIEYRSVYERTYTSSVALKDVGYGYDEVLSYVRQNEKNVDHVYFTNAYSQAYIYILLSKKLTPMEYQHGGLSNYTITNTPYADAKGKSGVLVVTTPSEDIGGLLPEKIIRYPDGKIAFVVVRL